MPMFDYRCRKCGNEFEELVFSRTVPDSDIACPNCKENDSERMVSAPMVATAGASTRVSSGGGCSSGFG